MNKIAITATTGIFPGATNLEEYWENILLARPADQISLQDRWQLERKNYYSDEVGKPNKIYLDQAFCIESLSEAPFFEDRQLVLGKRVLGQLFDRLGDKVTDLSRMALVLGASWAEENYFAAHTDYMIRGGDLEMKHLSLPGDHLQILKETFGLGGPTLAVDTACASSLYAIDIGIGLLTTGQADSVAVMGINAFLPSFLLAGFSRLTALSRDGRILPFSAEASGIVMGEGAGVVLLEPLNQAVENGRPILGVIHSIGFSADGVERSIFAPGPEGQKRALARAYQGLHPGEIDYIEAHGTATPTGDATEIAVLNDLFAPQLGKKKLPVGSVKSLIGHTLTAAGMASLIKGILMINKGVIPPHIPVKPHPDLEKTCLTLPTTPKPWPQVHRPRRIGISSFGFGGANSHLILESYAGDEKSRIGKEKNISLFTPLAIIDTAFELGEKNGRDSFPDNRFSRQPRRFFPGKYLPDHFTLDAARLRMGPKILERIDPLQLLATHLVSEVLVRQPQINESTELGVVFASNLGGGMAPRVFQKFDLLYNQKNRPQGYDTVYQSWVESPITLEEIASSLITMCSGYPANHFNFRGFHETLTGGEELFWTAFQLAPYWLKSHCQELLIGGGHHVKSPIELLVTGENLPLQEGFGVFYLKTLESARANSDQILATIDAIISADQASNFPEACKMAGVEPEDIDRREICQLNAREVAKIYTKQKNQSFPPTGSEVLATKDTAGITGFFKEATGVQVLARLLTSDFSRGVVEVRRGKDLVMMVFIQKVTSYESNSGPMKLPLQVFFQRPELAFQSEIASSSSVSTINNVEQDEPMVTKDQTLFAQLKDWQKTTGAVIRRFLQAQRETLEVLYSSGEGKVNSHQQLAWRDRLQPRQAKNIVINGLQFQPQYQRYVGDLLVDLKHPYFFDHPLDHVPGILMIEGIEQMAEILGRKLVRLDRRQYGYVRRIQVDFKAFCETRVPIEICFLFDQRPVGQKELSVHPRIHGEEKEIEIQIVQNQQIVAQGKLLYSDCSRSTQDSQLTESHALEEIIQQLILTKKLPISDDQRQNLSSLISAKLPSKRIVHKKHTSNILVTEMTHLGKGIWISHLLAPDQEHIFAQGSSKLYSINYIFETSRQFMMQYAHSVCELSLDMLISLIDIEVNLTRPPLRGESILVVSHEKELLELGSMKLITIEVQLWDRYGNLGMSRIKAQAVDRMMYEKQRWKEPINE